MKTASAMKLTGLLGLLRALHWSHWTTHWQVTGDPAYGDHMLFDRLYTGLPAEIDALAEKIVATFGVAAVDSVSQIGITTAVLRRWSAETGLISRALVAEKDLQEAVESTLTEMRATGEISNGMEDFLQALANAHETNLYLLKQRMTPAGKLASRYLRQI